MSQEKFIIKQTKNNINDSSPSGDFIVNQIKKLIKSDFSTDDEGILQFNKNGYQAKISDILNTIDKWYSRYSNSERK